MIPRVLFLLFMVCWGTGMASADEPKSSSERPSNLKLPTAGGKQFWTDELLFHHWRIQRNVVSGHYRLLDGKNVRHAWGKFQQCRDRLEEIKTERKLAPMGKHVVLVLHGLSRTRSAMTGLAKYLQDHIDDAEVLNVSYASTRGDLAGHAKALASVIQHLEGVEQVDLVAHSLGNLVIRHYLSDQTDPETGRYSDPRVHRIVMLAPPNNGASLAERFKENRLFAAIMGKSAVQLAENWGKLQGKLATPQCEFGIIAGGRGTESGANPLLEGDDDLVVTVAETKLAGARDFVVVPALHTFIMNDKKVRQYTLRFLLKGHFVAEDKRQPLESERPQPAPSP